MIYVIKGKHYVLVSGYYREVEIKKAGDDFVVTPVKDAKKIEASTVKKFTTTSIENATRKNTLDAKQ